MFHVTMLNVLHLCCTSCFQFNVVCPSLTLSLSATGFCAICCVLVLSLHMLSETLFLFVQSTNYCHDKKYACVPTKDLGCWDILLHCDGILRSCMSLILCATSQSMTSEGQWGILCYFFSVF